MLQKAAEKAEEISDLEISTSQVTMDNASCDISLRCEACNFTAEFPSKMIRHKETQKHKARVASCSTKQKSWQCACGKNYKHRASFYRHKKNCICYKTAETDNLKELLIAVMDENKELILG